MANGNRLGVFLIFVAMSLPASAQQVGGAAGQSPQASAGAAGANQVGNRRGEYSPHYTLGANDQILIGAPGMDKSTIGRFASTPKASSVYLRSDVFAPPGLPFTNLK